MQLQPQWTGSHPRAVNRPGGVGFIPFCIQITKHKRKNFTNELELLAVVWAIDRYEHYLLRKKYIIATGHKAITPALNRYKSN